METCLCKDPYESHHGPSCAWSADPQQNDCLCDGACSQPECSCPRYVEESDYDKDPQLPSEPEPSCLNCDDSGCPECRPAPGYYDPFGDGGGYG